MLQRGLYVPAARPARLSSPFVQTASHDVRRYPAPSRQAISNVSVRIVVGTAVRFKTVIMFKPAVNRAATDTQHFCSPAFIATQVCGCPPNHFVHDLSQAKILPITSSAR